MRALPNVVPGPLDEDGYPGATVITDCLGCSNKSKNRDNQLTLDRVMVIVYYKFVINLSYPLPSNISSGFISMRSRVNDAGFFSLNSLTILNPML